MQALEVKIDFDLMAAMKMQDTDRLIAIRGIKTAIMEMRTAKNAKPDIDDSDVLKILQKMAKERRDLIDLYSKNNRQDLADKEAKELEVIMEYLPKMLSEEELTEIVDKAIVELSATSMKDIGKVMGYINTKYAGQVDGSMASKIIRLRLQG